MKILNAGESTGYGTDANWDIKYQNGQFYSFTPNSTFKIYHIEYQNTVHINSLGGRISVENEVPDTTNIIPFMGDSYVMGVGVEDTETMVAQSKKLTNFNFLNLGVAGTSMPIQRKIINTRYNELGRPPAVIFGFLLENDFDDIIEVYSKQATVSDSVSTTKRSEKTVATPENNFMWKLNHFINTSFLKKLYSIQYIKQKILNIKNKGNHKAKDMLTIYRIINTLDSSYINQAKKDIDKEILLLSKEPYKPIVFIIPDQAQLNSTVRKNMCAYYGIDEKYIDPFLPNKLIITALNKYGITYIDPTPCLMARQNEGALYYTKDNHFTKLGHKIISECIIEFLKTSLQKLETKTSR